MIQTADLAGQPYLQVEHIVKKFGNFVALNDVSLDVQRGEFISFLGPSGCGKTTLLRCIAGLEIQDSGRVIQNGKDVSALPPSQRDFGIVFQSYALFPNLTVNQNIAYGLENQHANKQAIQQRVQELLTLVGLPDSGSKYPAQLSGGQQQRIALARALALSPGLLLLDEPLSALDAKVRTTLRTEILALHRSLGITTIMVTHDQEEALTMADRIAVMDHGHLVQIGSPREIYRNPRTPFVANFVGVMNFLTGTIVNSGTQVQAGRIHLNVPPTLSATSATADGTPVQVAIRPEDVRVAPAANGHAEQHHATLREVEFLGSFYRLRLDVTASDANQQPQTLIADLASGVARDLPLQIGSEIPFHIPADLVHVYAERGN